jgi:predicted TPR repeat methyltransferase
MSAVEHSRLGSVLLQSGRFREATESFRLALDADPTFVFAHNGLGIALKELGRLDDAAAAYRAALRFDSQHAPAHHNLGELLFRQGRAESACEAFEAALAADPTLMPAHLSLGNALADLGEFEPAIAHYRTVEAANSHPWAACLGLGTALSRAGQTREAVRYFLRAAALRPDSPETHYNLGRAELQVGNVGVAVQSLQRALELKPDFPQAEALLAAALWSEGQVDAAVVHWQRASPQDTERRTVYFALADTLLRLGMRKEAQECFEEFLRLEPDYPPARHLVAALRGENPEQPVDRYVEEVFDAYAATFDAHLQDTLRYTVPRLLADRIAEVATRSPPWDILDLGCGTGLLGAALAPRSRRLVGIDLSARMLELAQGQGLYERLERAGIVAALAREAPADYDVVGAADVFIYVGRLDETVEQVRAVLRPTGLFAFSIEAPEHEPLDAPVSEPGYRLTTTGRYVHSLPYLQRLAKRYEFTERFIQRVRLRLEDSRPVWGWIIVWEAVTAGSLDPAVASADSPSGADSPPGAGSPPGERDRPE